MQNFMKWANLSKSYLLEAKWYHKEIKPTLEDYLENAWVSVTWPLMLLHSFFFATNPKENEILEMKHHYPSIIQLSSKMVRLADDLGTAPVCDYLPNSIMFGNLHFHLFYTQDICYEDIEYSRGRKGQVVFKLLE